MKTLEVLGGGAIAVFVLAAIVVGLMELHAPAPAFACPDPLPPCQLGCFTEDGCLYTWDHTTGNCCFYKTDQQYPCDKWKILCL